MFSSWLAASTISAALIRIVMVIGFNNGASVVRSNTFPVALNSPESGGILPDGTNSYVNCDAALTAPAPTSIVTSPSGETNRAALSGTMATTTSGVATTALLPSLFEEVSAPDANKPPIVAATARTATIATMPKLRASEERGS